MGTEKKTAAKGTRPRVAPQTKLKKIDGRIARLRQELDEATAEREALVAAVKAKAEDMLAQVGVVVVSKTASVGTTESAA